MKEAIEWKSFRKYNEFDEKQKNKAIRDNFKTILLLMMKEDSEIKKIFDIEKESAERLGLKAFPFYTDIYGNVYVRNTLEIDGRRKKTKNVKEELNQIKEWLIEYYNPQAKLLLCLDTDEVTPVILNPIKETKELSKRKFDKRVSMLEQQLGGDDLKKIKELKMKAIFGRKEVNREIDEIMEKFKEEKKKQGREAYIEMRENIKKEKEKIKKELTSVGYVRKMDKWLSENEGYGFSETMELLYIEKNERALG